jgi:hypothetical protein
MTDAFRNAASSAQRRDKLQQKAPKREPDRLADRSQTSTVVVSQLRREEKNPKSADIIGHSHATAVSANRIGGLVKMQPPL